FAEKSRLTVEYLSYSFSFFRQAKTDCSRLLELAKANGTRTVVCAGQSDLAEIAVLSAAEHAIKIVGIVQANASTSQFIGRPVFQDFDSVSEPFDAVLITALDSPQEICEAAIARF